jgi:hypothetical protein
MAAGWSRESCLIDLHDRTTELAATTVELTKYLYSEGGQLTMESGC